MDTTSLSYSVPGYRTPHHRRRALIRTLAITGAVLFSLLLGGITGWSLHASTTTPTESITTPSPTSRATPSGVPSSPAGTGAPSPAATVPAVAP